jgi:hypothetical protein
MCELTAQSYGEDGLTFFEFKASESYGCPFVGAVLPVVFNNDEIESILGPDGIEYIAYTDDELYGYYDETNYDDMGGSYMKVHSGGD